MPARHDGPASPLFEPLPFEGNLAFEAIADAQVSPRMQVAAARWAATGSCTGWGIPFEIGKPVFARDAPVTVAIGPVTAAWLVFAHTTDYEEPQANEQGFFSPTRGEGRLGEHLADYVLVYADGSEARQAIRRRYQIGMLQRGWGENCFEAVAMTKPWPLAAVHEQESRWPARGRTSYWGITQTRVLQRDSSGWTNFLWAWENPHPKKRIVALRVEPAAGTVVISGVTAGRVRSLPLRWETRRKALLRLSKGQSFDPNLDETGRLKAIQLDLGQVISAQPRFAYDDQGWTRRGHRELPEIVQDEIVVEYAAHPEASFHLEGGAQIPVARVEAKQTGGRGAGLSPVQGASQRVTLRIVDGRSKQPVPVKLHLHGESGEYLAPLDHHRIPNPSWFEDYGADAVAFDFMAGRFHYSSYVPGETTVDLPLGRVYLQVTKGFEIKPVHKLLRVTPSTKKITVTLDHVLPWRSRGWVTADTHVHFLSPKTAELEGAAEGVNVINLLASQWGELMTNAGDFDGRTTFGSREAGGDGEWLVRVGTENRQHVLGHISLIGYSGQIISPMCSGGPDEAALGDPVDVLLTEWARQCRAQGGLAVFPHFPAPRTENAAAIVHGDVDAIEMCSIGNPWNGIDPYSLSDWYRYLNCGYFVPAVGGTDKMQATTSVGTIRTYARIPDDREFSYEAWMDAVRAGDTFVSYGPLMEFRVEGRRPGERIEMGTGGGTVDVEWELASVTVPMTRVELVVNGEIRESKKIGAKRASGQWRVKLDRSSWLALLVRGEEVGRPETIAAHSSPVVAAVLGSRFFAAADATTILEQIEGAIAYLDTVGTRADDRARKRMRLVLTAAHRKLHNEMHRRGRNHEHTPVHDHAAHR